MNEKKRENSSDSDFEKALEGIDFDIPPENITSRINPWKTSVNRVLVGTALTAVTLNFLCLEYILPAIGTVLMLLGLRSLQHENKWFSAGFAISVFRGLLLFVLSILNTTVIPSVLFGSAVKTSLAAVNVISLFLEIICIRQAISTVQKKAELKPHVGAGTALILWYACICVLAFIGYSGFIVPILMLISYFFILRNLFRLSKELDEAGYVIKSKPVKITDSFIVVSVTLLLTLGMVCGYAFGGSYPMKWSVYTAADSSETQAIKENLKSMGFPEYVLDDLKEEDIALCKDALKVTVRISNRSESGEYVDEDGVIRFTNLGVKVSGGEQEAWVLFHHFLWTENPGFYGTESIQLWPTYKTNADSQKPLGEVSGQILYDDAGKTFTADYYSLAEETYTSTSIINGQHRNTDIFATFSMPDKGSNHRGYLAYPISVNLSESIVNSWINYTHQQIFLQYPAVTAAEKRMSYQWNDAGAFQTYQEQLIF